MATIDQEKHFVSCRAWLLGRSGGMVLMILCYHISMNSIESISASGNNEPELALYNTNSEMAKWLKGMDPATKQPKPFDLDLTDNVYTQSELNSIIEGKSKEEAEEIIRNNHEALIRNNEIIEQFNERILDFSEMGRPELESLYNDGNLSESDKSIISCIGIIRSAYEDGYWSDEEKEVRCFFNDEKELFDNVLAATEGIYGFDVVVAQEKLKKANSHFTILTKEQREGSLSGTIEDVASAALESFIRIPDYSNSRILDYDEFLYGVLQDCKKRRVVIKNGVDTIDTNVDLEEFQDRVIESMSWQLMDAESKNSEYSTEEFEKLRSQVVDMYADLRSGHYFPNDFDRFNTEVKVDGKNRNIFSMSASSWKQLRRRIRKNNSEVFRYNKEVADTEMKQWADKVDLNEIESINNNDSLSYEDKLTLVIAHVQKSFDIKNLDIDGQSHPIRLEWFRFEESKLVKLYKKLFNIPTENEELPEEYAGAYYCHSDRSVHFQKPSKLEAGRLSDWTISTVCHELWHAKEHELDDEGNNGKYYVNANDIKARMYHMNFLAYTGLERSYLLNGNQDYYSQIAEQEAYAVGGHIRARLDRMHNKKRGNRVLNIIKSILDMG